MGWFIGYELMNLDNLLRSEAHRVAWIHSVVTFNISLKKKKVRNYKDQFSLEFNFLTSK